MVASLNSRRNDRISEPSSTTSNVGQATLNQHSGAAAGRHDTAQTKRAATSAPLRRQGAACAKPQQHGRSTIGILWSSRPKQTWRRRPNRLGKLIHLRAFILKPDFFGAALCLEARSGELCSDVLPPSGPDPPAPPAASVDAFGCQVACPRTSPCPAPAAAGAPGDGIFFGLCSDPAGQRCTGAKAFHPPVPWLSTPPPPVSSRDPADAAGGKTKQLELEKTKNKKSGATTRENGGTQWYTGYLFGSVRGHRGRSGSADDILM